MPESQAVLKIKPRLRFGMMLDGVSGGFLPLASAGGHGDSPIFNEP
jgi:hypothetical protein